MKFQTKVIKNAVSSLLKNVKGSEIYFKAYALNAIVTMGNKTAVGAVKVEAMETATSEEFGMSAKFLHDMLSSLDSEEVVIQQVDNRIEVKGGKSRWNLVSLSNVSPTYSPVKEPTFVLGFSKDRYQDMMSRALPFIATEETISAFNGLSVIAEGDECSIYGASRSCFSKQTFKISTPVETKKEIVLWREIAALSLPGDVEWRFADNVIEVVSENERYTMPLLAATPPAFDKAFPSLEGAKEIVLAKSAFADASERVGLCARVVESSAIHLTINNESVRLYANSEMIGDAEENVTTLNKTGVEGETVGISVRHLEKMVKAVSSVKVKITYTGDPLKPLVFENDAKASDSDVQWIGLVAPVRLKN